MAGEVFLEVRSPAAWVTIDRPKRRNALSKTSPGFALRTGDVGTVLETFGTGEAFLVEFNKNGKAAKGECDWMGVLYPTEVELGTGPDKG